jgi:hypothetical protein
MLVPAISKLFLETTKQNGEKILQCLTRTNDAYSNNSRSVGLYPSNRNRECEFYLNKLPEGFFDDSYFKYRVMIQNTDGKEFFVYKFEQELNFSSGEGGWGWSNLLPISDIFNPEKKYLSNDNTLTLVIYVRTCSLLLLISLNILIF